MLARFAPKGAIPTPIPVHETPHFADDAVRAAISSFGPRSAAGLFGNPPCYNKRFELRPSTLVHSWQGA